jgi:hypothetical protein
MIAQHRLSKPSIASFRSIAKRHFILIFLLVFTFACSFIFAFHFHSIFDRLDGFPVAVPADETTIEEGWIAFPATSVPYTSTPNSIDFASPWSDYYCSDLWIARGELCTKWTELDLEIKVDFVWSWVNGTSRRGHEARLEAEDIEYGRSKYSSPKARRIISAAKARHFR